MCARGTMVMVMKCETKMDGKSEVKFGGDNQIIAKSNCWNRATQHAIVTTVIMLTVC